MLSLARDAAQIAVTEEPQRAEARVAAVDIVRDPATVAEEWGRFQETAVGHVFQTHEFVTTWLATVGRERGLAPRIVIGRGPDGSLLFLLPFGIRRCMGARVLEWLGGEQADYHAGLFAPRFLITLAPRAADREAFVRQALAALSGEIDVVHFQRQPERIGGIANPFAAYHPIPFTAHSHLTHLGACWDTYYRAKRGSSSRRHDRLKWEKLQALGAVETVDAVTPEQSEPILDALFAMKEKSLAAMGVPSVFRSPSARDFYRALARAPYPCGPSHVSAILLDGAVVAANWGLVRGNHYYYVMTSYDAGEVSRASPGRALMYHLMRWSIARGIDTFDFTIGDEDYKSQWCEETSALFDSVVAVSSRGLPLASSLKAMKAAKRAIKARPRLKRMADQLRRLSIRTG